MKKSEIVIGGTYLFNPNGKNRYLAFHDSEWLGRGAIEVRVLSWEDKDDLEVTTDNCKQSVYWRELRPLK